jgi:6-phosphofructokinase 1
MRVGVLTGGGDCPGLNAVIRAVTKSLIGHCNAEVVGIKDGFLGLVEGRTRALDWHSVSGITARGGTILGTTNHFDPLASPEATRAALDHAATLKLDALVAIGGDGTMTIAHGLGRHGLCCIGVPKTIDNDIEGNERSFGFDTAVATVTEALDRVQTTAQSHGRVMIVETMGRNAGWLALEAGIAGAADVILLPEIDYDIEVIAARCREREQRERFTVICVAEGAKARGAQQTVEQRIAERPEPVRLGGIGHVLREQLQSRVTTEVRATVLGHVQRGGTPTAFDRVLATHFGIAAAALVHERRGNQMVALNAGAFAIVPMSAVAGRTRRVGLDHPLMRCAEQIGVCLGC